jgi:glucokinase
MDFMEGMKFMILAGDIGGTKTLLGLFDREKSIKAPIRQKTFPSQKYSRLETIIAEFLADDPVKPTAACFAVAGPVREGNAQITNLPWVIAAESICQAFEIPVVHLMNDVQATAAAIPFMDREDLAAIRTGVPDPHGTVAVIAPGTGLGEAYLTWNGQRYLAYPSEGGHASFAPGSDLEVELLTYLYPRFGHLSFERVGSGSGIPNLYGFFRDTGRYPEPDWLKRELEAAEDPTPVIMVAGYNRRAEICTATFDLFMKILGGEIGNMALKLMATGGIYLGGGISPRILDRLREEEFLETISRKGRFKKLLDSIPVYVILDPEVTLHGAAFEAQALLSAQTETP